MYVDESVVVFIAIGPPLKDISFASAQLCANAALQEPCGKIQG